MAKASSPDRAAVRQILLWYDDPEILLLKKSHFEYIIAVGSIDDDFDNAFVGASMTIKQLSDYQSGKFDLRYLMSHANLRRYWKFNFDPNDEEVDLKRVTRGSDFVSQSIPEPGFFSRSHAAIEVAKELVPDADERFDIDGSWELGEFSRLYGQIEDIYYMFNDLRRFVSPKTTPKEKAVISEAFHRPWRGGGSYVGFYDNIANDNAPIARLKVSGIQYNSPGFVKLKAKKEPFDNIIALLQAYAHEPVIARKSYNVLYKFLSFNKLLKASDETILRPVIEEETIKLSRNLEACLPGISFDTLKAMAQGNTLVASKVLMSIFRRLERLFKFFEEGRVKYDGLDVDPLLDTES